MALFLCICCFWHSFTTLAFYFCLFFFFFSVVVFLCYISPTAILQCFSGVVMATASTVATSVDVLSAAERAVVVESLELRVAQLRRAMNSESDPDIKAIRVKAIAAVEALAVKFR